MTDIVARLRERAGLTPSGLMDEAADEIEQLTALHEAAAARAELAQIEIERLRKLSQNNASSWDAIVRERDETGIDGLLMRYFVLKPAGQSPYARASRMAMRKYADSIKGENPDLARQLGEWVDRTHAEAWVASQADAD